MKMQNIKIQKSNLERKPVGRRKESGPLVEGSSPACLRRRGQKNQACRPTHALSNTFHTHWLISGIGVNRIKHYFVCSKKAKSSREQKDHVMDVTLSRRPSHTPSSQASGPGSPSAQNSPSTSPSHRSLDLGWLQVPQLTQHTQIKSGISDGCTLCNCGAMSEQTVILLTLSPRDSFGKKKIF